MAGIQDSTELESERPRVVTEQRILTPTLVILLGSTPALAGLELMRHMLSLKESDLRHVALVYIDTDDPPNTVVDFQRSHKGKFQEFSLRIAVPAGISQAPRIHQGLSYLQGLKEEDLLNLTDDERTYLEESEQHTFIQHKEPQYFANGAGGIRNNGHVACCFNYHSIYNTLDAALGKVTRLGIDQGDTRAREVQANLVAFLGGGTGSSILADVAVMVRELFASRQLKQRINLLCMLPEPVRGANDSDLKWRKSNATASMLELLAYSKAATGSPQGYYEKYMRANVHRLTNDPIANEVYLIGRAGMGDAVDTARIIGVDLFQRITDASGVGFLEHSKWVDRRTLGESDDRGLPTMFGTSCPLEVRFPAEETAMAFAQISAARLLPLIASYQPKLVVPTDTEKRNWSREWRSVARFEANANDPQVVKLPEFRKSDFEKAKQGQLDILWSRLEKQQPAIAARIQEIIDTKSREEMRLIADVPRQEGDLSLLHNRVQYLQRLKQKYETALDELKEKEMPKVPGRPLQLERKLTNPDMVSKVMGGGNAAGVVCEAYNKILQNYAIATRYRLLETLLKKLIASVDETLDFSLSWFKSAEVEERARKFEEMGYVSMAWQGRLDYPHPHQRHIFDLRTLRAVDGRSIATEQLYRWATGGDPALADGTMIDYSVFLADCIRYITTYGTVFGNAQQSRGDLERHNPKRLPDRVVNFFRDRYMEKFQDTNLFELLEKSAPPAQRGQSRAKQISEYLLEHLQHMRGLMSSLVAFEAELWHEGLASLDTSLYLGMHWHDSWQKEILDATLDDLGTLTERGQAPMVNAAIDPHRLQISYGQHAISIGTIRDFYLDRNSAMEAYIYHQEEWENTNGRGNMPVHSSGAAEHLVTNEQALGSDKKLRDRVVRQQYSHSKSNSQRPGAQAQPQANPNQAAFNLEY